MRHHLLLGILAALLVQHCGSDDDGRRSPPNDSQVGDGDGDTDSTDTDADGLTDAQEVALGTNPAVADTDGDTLSDGAEVHTHGTSPLLADTDGDGYSDADELDEGTNPNDAASRPGPVVPPSPEEVAPPFDAAGVSDFAAGVAFLYEGANALQTGVEAGAIDPSRVAVVRGRVLRADGRALPGVTIAVLGAPQLGHTVSRSDGWFDLAVNGGGVLSVTYNRAGYLAAQRQVTVPRRDYAFVDDVALNAPDPIVTPVALGSSASQVARASEASDTDGARTATLVFPPNLAASMVLPDASVVPLTTLSVRATEFTVGARGPARMPASLPPTTAYTYAVELSVDEAMEAGAELVQFNAPVPFYVENFLNFAVGTAVPVGYFDRALGQWRASDNGRVIEVVGADQGFALIDADGDTLADDDTALSALGITADERAMLATLYLAGESLWRVPVTHFTPWDMNWTGGPPPGSSPPNGPPPPEPNSCNAGEEGSIVYCQNQTMTKSVPVAGTPFTLSYDSRNSFGYAPDRTLTFQLVPADVPDDVLAVELEIDIAGRKFKERIEAPTPGMIKTFVWDGKDAYGRALQGKHPVRVRRGYSYQSYYYEPADWDQAWASVSGIPITGNPARNEVTLWNDWQLVLGTWDARGFELGGFNLSVQQAYDPIDRAVIGGEGERRDQSAMSANIIKTVIGGAQSGGIGDGGPALSARLFHPSGLAVAADGTVYIADSGNQRVRRVTPDGIITTVAGNGTSCSPPTAACGDGGPAVDAKLSSPAGVAVTPDGVLYIADRATERVRRVNRDGTLSRFAGTGAWGFSGDGGLAINAQLSSPYGVAVAPDGGVYIADTGNNRIRYVNSEGIITTVVGGGTRQPADLGDGGPANEAVLQSPWDVALGPDGSLYIVGGTGTGTIRRVSPTGIIETIAGSGGYVDCDPLDACGDGGPAVDATLGRPYKIAVGPDGSILVPDWDHHRLRIIGPDGIISTLAGTGEYGNTGDNGPAGQAKMSDPNGVAFDPSGGILMTDDWFVRVRRISSALASASPSGILVADQSGESVSVFSNSGRLLRVLHGFTGATLFELTYDAAFRLTSVADGSGNVTTIERTSAGAPSAILGPYGHRTSLTLDAEGRLSAVTSPLGETHSFTYDAQGMMTQGVLPRGDTSIYTYDSAGRLIEAQSDAAGRRTLARTDLDTMSFDVAFTRPKDGTSSYLTTYRVTSYGDGSQDLETTLPNGNIGTASTYPIGSSRQVHPDGTELIMRFGGDPRFGTQAPVIALLSVQQGSHIFMRTSQRTAVGASAVDPFAFTSQTESTSVNGRLSTLTYTVATRVFASTSAEGRTESRGIDAFGRVVSRDIPGFDGLTWSYDTRGRLAEFVHGTAPNERRATFTYGTDGEVDSATDPLGQATTYDYDGVGRLTTITLPGARVVQLGYDANGNRTSITPPGRTAHTFSFDGRGQHTQYTPPAASGSGSTTYTRNPTGDLTHVAQPGGRSISLAYDAGAQLTSITLAEGAVVAAYHGTTGLMTTLSAPGGVALTFSYDGPLPTSEALAGPVVGSVSRTYDDDFRVASETAGGVTSTYVYDDDGLMVAAGGLTLTRSATDHLLHGSTLGAVQDTRLFDAKSEMASYSASASGSLYSATYTRDALGRVTRVVESVAGGASTTIDYDYDAANRLATVTRDSVLTESYTYDANGNRLSGTVAGTTKNGSYDAQDRLTSYGGSTFSYTGNGELASRTASGQTTQYQHDAFGNLRGVVLPGGTSVDYVLDGFFRRVGKKVNGALVRGYLYDTAGRIVVELDGGNNPVARFVYAGRDNVPAVVHKGGVQYRVITDHTGSVRLVVSSVDGSVAQRLDYDAFGRVSQDTSPGFQPFGFAGGLVDQDTGLVHFNARDYDPEYGRWLEKDPLLFRGGSWNLYAYVDNDPVSYRDPSGYEISPDSDAYVPPPPPTRMERMKQRWQDFKRWTQDRIDDVFGWFGKKFNQYESCTNGTGGRSIADCVKLICSTPGLKFGAGGGGSAAADAAESVGDQGAASYSRMESQIQER